MKSKFIEIRDAGTRITAIAIKTEGENEKEHQFFRSGGWGANSVILLKTNGETIVNYDPFEWRSNGTRTMFEAHRYIQEHFDDIENYSVIDIEYILGIKQTIKESEIWRD